MTSPSKLRVAVIGAGSMANHVHYPSLASFADVEIAAICDLDEGRLNSTADKYGVRHRYTNYRKMVDEVAPVAVYAIGQPHIEQDQRELALQHQPDAALRILHQRDNHHSARMAHVLAHCALAVGQAHRIAKRMQEMPLEQLDTIELLFDQVAIAHRPLGRPGWCCQAATVGRVRWSMLRSVRRPASA